MIGLIIDFYAATDSGLKVPFRLAWKRARHIRYGHPFPNSETVDKLKSEKHPHSNSEYIYTVNIRKCNDCGLIFHDSGLEIRRT